MARTLRSVPSSPRGTPRRQAPTTLSYVEMFRATPSERIRIIKQGLPAADAKRILSDLALTQKLTFEALKLSVATVNRKAAKQEALSPDESERVIGVAKLIGQLQAMIEESGSVDGFDARAWISRWLEEPLPALGNEAPVNLLDTMEGQALVAETLSKMQSGAYA